MIHVLKTMLDDYFLFTAVVNMKELLASMITKTDLKRVRFVKFVKSKLMT